jgi:hypothetical protein
MGKGAQASEKSDPRDIENLSGHHPSPRASKPGRRSRKKTIPELGPVLAKTVRHFLPGLPGLLRRLPDARNPDQLYYPKETLVWSALLMFLLALKSRRQFRFESVGPAFLANLNALAGTWVETASHDDTVVYYLKRVAPEHFGQLPVYVVRRLIRMKALDRWRLWGAFPIAIDGTGQLFFRKRHCPHCLTRTGPDGRTVYFHNVVEAKLVTPTGLALSIATEFIENPQPHADKQDCELKAFPRLAEKLKANFPRLPIVLLGDSLYACKPVFDICKKNRWHFIFTFKRGALPALFAEFEALRDYAGKNRVADRKGQTLQHFAWVNDLDYQGHMLSAFECREDRPDGHHYFAWISDIPMGCRSVVTASNQGGRLRWKVENEGFNIQKNHGYELEHAYCSDESAVKILYYLLQVAHAINQLMIHGSLLRPFHQLLGSLRNFLRQLARSFATSVIAACHWHAATAMQIRLDSS